MPCSSRMATIAEEVLFEIGMGIGMGLTRWMVDDVTQSAPGEVIVEEQCRLVGRAGALEERTEHADDDGAAAESGQGVTGSLRACGGIELVPVLRQSRRSRHVVVRAERDHENVGVVGRGIGDDPATARDQSRSPSLVGTPRQAWRCVDRGSTLRRPGADRT